MTFMSCPVPDDHSLSRKKTDTLFQAAVGCSRRKLGFISNIFCVVGKEGAFFSDVARLHSCSLSNFLFPSVQQKQARGERQEYIVYRSTVR